MDGGEWEKDINTYPFVGVGGMTSGAAMAVSSAIGSGVFFLGFWGGAFVVYLALRPLPFASLSWSRGWFLGVTDDHDPSVFSTWKGWARQVGAG